jgi:hypothetical protein
MFDLDIDETRIKWYIGLFKGRNPQDVFKALRAWAMTTRERRLPMPGELLTTPGELVAGKIIQAISRFGRHNPHEAKDFLGDGWRVVEMLGGWFTLCENQMAKDNRTLFAHARDIWNKLELKGEVSGAHRSLTGQSNTKDIGPPTSGKLEHASGGVSRALTSCGVKRSSDIPEEKP